MEVFRLCAKKHADLSGVGGLYGSARWHYQGQPIIYTASCRSLSALERFVHEQQLNIPQLAMITIWLPDGIKTTHYSESELPDGWDSVPDSDSSRNIGDRWLKDKVSAVMKVPSAIITNEYNYLINPLHDDAKKIKVIDVQSYFYDVRLKKMIR